MNTKGLGYLVTAFAFTLFGLFLAKTETGNQIKEAGTSARTKAFDSAVHHGLVEAKTALYLENPEILATLKQQNLFGRNRLSIKHLKEHTTVTSLGNRTWQINLNGVNATLFETENGLVLVDTGSAPAGPALVNAIKSISQKPLQTIIYTQGSSDIAFGSWALIEEGWNPEIIAHASIGDALEKFAQRRNALARTINEPIQGNADIVWPSRTFNDKEALAVGEEIFHLKHHQDQTYVWVPSRKTLVGADFLKHGITLADPLREMEELDAKLFIPSHGDPLKNRSEIEDRLTSRADFIEQVRSETLTALKEGKSRREILQAANNSNAANLSESIINQYALCEEPLDHEEASTIVELAGGTERIIQKAKEQAPHNLPLAVKLAQWAYLAHPENRVVREGLIEILKLRVTDPSASPEEIVSSINLMTEARRRTL